VYDASANLRWKWEQVEAFGNNLPDENPSSLGVFLFELGMPGQIRDRETGLFYNLQSDAYNPSVGGYTQPEPLGVAGDINLYRYARSNPIAFIDPDGRQAAFGAGGGGAATGGFGSFGGFGGRQAPNGSSGMPGSSELERALRNPTGMASSSSAEEEPTVSPTPDSCYEAYKQAVDLLCPKLKTKSARSQCYQNAMKVYSDCLAACKNK
jgi:RHS repeat-associated protein